jgi:hypothetical protein
MAYPLLLDVWTEHTRFEQLRGLPVVQDAAAAIRVYKRDSNGCLDPGDKLVVGYDALTKHNRAGPSSAPLRQEKSSDARPVQPSGGKPQKETFTNVQPIQAPVPPVNLSDALVPKVISSGSCLKLSSESQDWFAAHAPGTAAAQNEPAGWTPVSSFLVGEISPPAGYVQDHPEEAIWVDVNVPGDIKVVTADNSTAISSIQLATGEWVHRKSRLALIGGLLVPLLFPVIGFFLGFPFGER